MTTLLKDPDDVADYAVDFTELLATGETLSNPTVTVPTGLTLTPAGKAAPAVSGSKVVFWLSGGTLNDVYTVQVEADTSGGRHFAESFRLLANTRA